jgi:uncharacterized protein (TIGR02453 family)
MSFQGWPPQALAWFEGLEQDNSKAYFTATRDVYETSVRGPLLELLAEVADEFGEAHVFRPYRDVRFSADKSPYKRQASAVLGDWHGSGASYYLEISLDGVLAASGYYHMDRGQLTRFRQAVDEDRSGDELVGIVEDLEKGGYRIHGETLKSAPRGFAKDHPRIRLLRHKGLAVMADLPPEEGVHSRRVLDHVTTTWRAAGPLNSWLAEHVGAPAEAPEGPPR